MQESEARLGRDGYRVEDQPIHAGREIGLLHGVPIQIGDPRSRSYPTRTRPCALFGDAISR